VEHFEYLSDGHIFCFRRILEEKWEYIETVHQLFVDFKKAYDSVRREVLYNILIEFVVPMKLVRLIEACIRINEMYSYIKVRVYIDKHLSDNLPVQKGQEMFYRHCFSTLL
jgi:hypothetical protein